LERDGAVAEAVGLARRFARASRFVKVLDIGVTAPISIRRWSCTYA
jgi:hypothetical protein